VLARTVVVRWKERAEEEMWRRREMERGLKKRERHLERIGSAAMQSQTAILVFRFLRGRDQQVC
jgi:hypothetical protein